MDANTRIRERRIELGLSQGELAEAVGYTGRSAIARMEAGRNKVDIEKLELFAKALHTTTAYIMGITDNPKPTHYTAATSDERQLLAAYRHANDDGKNVFRALTAYFLPPTE